MKKKCIFTMFIVMMLFFSTTFVWAGNNNLTSK